MKNQLARVVILGMMASSAAFAEAEKTPDWDAETLSGNWGGARSSLHEKGVTVKLTHKSDLLANTAGGVSRGSVWLANSEARVSLDLDKLAGWDATTAFFQYHLQHGGKSINNYVGSFAGVDNIESNTNAGQFFQAWLQKNSADDSLSVLGGLYAIDSEFYVTETSGLFIQPPYGMSAEMSQTGKNGPPIFPVGALGLRVKYSASGYYLQGALTDGVPGNPVNPQGTQIRLDRGDGTLAIVEFGANTSAEGKPYNKTALGFWRYTARAERNPALAPANVDAFGNPLRYQDRGFYFLAERTPCAAYPALSGFVRFGAANQDIYQADWSGSLGMQYQGPFDGREGDTAGIAVTTIHTSGWHRRLNAAKSAETTIEMTYRAQLQPWLAIQPMLQRIFNPNMDPVLRDAWLAGVRIEAAF